MVHEDLDQHLEQYQTKLQTLSLLWSKLVCQGYSDQSPVKAVSDLMSKLEEVGAKVIDREVSVQRARQTALELKAVLGVSRQSVMAKSKHLNQEEIQKEEVQAQRFKEFQKIHKYQEETAALEDTLAPTKSKLSSLMETLDERNEKMRNLENFYQLLSDQCVLDLACLKDQTEAARSQRGKWDSLDTDIGSELDGFLLNSGQVKILQEEVYELKEAMHNHKNWYDEELKTKLFLSTRSKELKHRIAYFKNALRRLERTGRSDEDENLADRDDMSHVSVRSENMLVDGIPGIKAKEVEQYLSRTFGMRVLADYTMLKRLKEEIGVQGLAYLVEKIRLETHHGLLGSISTERKHMPDWEEKKMEQALRNIAMEYRAQDENQGILCVPGLSEEIQRPPAGQGNNTGTLNKVRDSPSSMLSLNSEMTDVSRRSSFSGSRGSSSRAPRRKPSLARIKKFLKL